MGKLKKDKKVKEIFSRAEVLNIIYSCLGHFASKHDIVIDGRDITKWIEKNL